MLATEDVDALRKQIEALQLQQRQLEARLSQQQQQRTPSMLRDSSPFAEPPQGPATPATPFVPPSPCDNAAPSVTSFPLADSQGQVQPPTILRAVPRSTVRPDCLSTSEATNHVVWPRHESLASSETSSQESALKEGSKLVAKGLRGTMKSAVKLWFMLVDKADEYAEQTKAQRRASGRGDGGM